MRDGARPEGELGPAGAKPDSWRRAAAGALAGIATGGFLVSLLAQIHIREGWSVGAYEPAAALLGALGVWWFGARRGARDGWIAVGAAMAAMLLGDVFWILAHTPHTGWSLVPAQLFAEFGWDWNSGPRFHLGAWPKLLRYAFGLYVSWYVGAAGRDRTEPDGGIE